MRYLVKAAALLSVLLVGCRADTTRFSMTLPESADRVWIGADFYANRLMDWHLAGGRIECTEGRAAKPMRTLHLLTRSLAEGPGSLDMSVRTGAIAPGDTSHAGTWSGFLIGAGGSHVDFRISSLAHHWPAEDGGIIVAVDGTGSIVVRSNTNADAPKGPSANMTSDAWPLYEASSRQGAAAGPAREYVLSVSAEPREGSYGLDVTLRDGQTGALVQTARYEGMGAEHLSGNVALVSHTSPRMEGPGYWFEDWTLSGSKIEHHPDRAFGPVLGTQYTISGGTLNLTAQMAALGSGDARTARLEVERGGRWQTLASAELIEDSFTIPFRAVDWEPEADAAYRIAYELDGKAHHFGGTLRAPRTEDGEFVLASLNCQNISQGRNLVWNHTTIWYPHADLTQAVARHDPDMLFFAGDQIYEGGLAGIVRTPTSTAILDYHYHWYRFVWAFRDLMRDRPTVTIPDDHDVYHGNIWGDGGIRAEGDARPLSDNGGYIMDPRFVNAVHRTQVSHLPDPYDPAPIEQDITVYYTGIRYGGVSFAVVADRMWKSTPRKVLPEAEIRNGWPQNPDFDTTVPTEATLLGPRQLDFLSDWVHDFSGDAWMKVMLSQTLFSNLATLPGGSTDDSVVPRMRYPEPGEYVADDQLGTDMDSNGWPQKGRNRALRIIRKGFALHVAGDQHLGSFVRYGIDDFDDGPHAFISPAIANVWPRRWFPPTPGAERAPDAPRYTGRHLDGFGNHMTVRAVANPVRSGRQPEALYDRVPGYGIIRFDRPGRSITAEAWPRWIDPAAADAAQYAGWPVTISQEDNYGRARAGYLPMLESDEAREPVVQVIHEESGEVLYTLRVPSGNFRPWVFDAGATHTVALEHSSGERLVASGLRVAQSDTARIHFTP